METKNEVGKELPFAYSLQDIARSVFIVSDDPRRGQKIEDPAGFYVTSNSGQTADQLATMMEGQGGIDGWARSIRQHFDPIIQLIAVGKINLNSRTLENNLRYGFFNYAEIQASQCRTLIAEQAIFGGTQGEKSKVDNAQKKLARIVSFQEKLTAKAGPTATPTT